MKNAIFAVLIAVSLFACKATQISNNEQSVDPENLTGQWDWKRTTGGFAGINTTPETARYILHIEFKNNELLFYKNNVVTQQYHYTITKNKTIYSTEPLYIINPDTTVNAIPLVITKMVKDTIILADNVNDGFSSTYVKRTN
ncbi:hypothetical protein LJ707_03660 [Mucilaginibacter sp. UR6-1]|uniref:hypothetical protein n=1 Tax=Mucilaginibacter sp. UR6-1 TaxID=1435643 RepID=UPI001E5E788F|nr:hypothetical protein [Mucilaginibacter sp. UR6-1]MCC8408011.1 hypothetical protein [Mucilaginibacter sp. UR6-1]